MNAAHQQQVEAAEFYFQIYELLSQLNPTAQAARLRDVGANELTIPAILAMSLGDRQELILAVVRDIADQGQSRFDWNQASTYKPQIGDPGEWAFSYGYMGGWPNDVY